MPQLDAVRNARIALQGLRAWVLNSHGPLEPRESGGKASKQFCLRGDLKDAVIIFSVEKIDESGS